MQQQIHRRNGSLYSLLALFSVLPVGPLSVHALNDMGSYNGIPSKCSFFDSVNVTGYPTFPNGSYNYEGMIIPRHYVGTFDYIYTNRSHRVDVAPHTRGCICKLKPCINFCCPWGYKNKNSVCQKDTSSSALWPEPILNVTQQNGFIGSVNIFEQYAIQSFKPCQRMMFFLPEFRNEKTFSLFENGTLLRVDDMLYQYKEDFCFAPVKLNDTDLYYTIYPAYCVGYSQKLTVGKFNKSVMLLSMPFMLLTIAIYLLISDLRNEHGKCLVCYLSGLTIGYSVLCSLWLIKGIYPFNLSCSILGYTAYFAFMSAFFWLNVISFDLWNNFRGTRSVNQLQKKNRFAFYSLYAWGSSSVFLICTFLVQEYSGWSIELLPGIGGRSCFLNMKSWSAMIYFYGPVLVIIVANSVMFVMTALKIRGVQREMSRITAGEDSTKNLHSEKDKFKMFFRLFLIMGVTWSLEIISYLVGDNQSWSKIFYVSDFFNVIQGLLIFVLFVLKKKVRNLISNRIFKHKTISGNKPSSTKSTPAGISSTTQ